jgi:enoyl-CoA hydratase/carnithine racemase
LSAPGTVPGNGGAWLLPHTMVMSKASETAFRGKRSLRTLACELVSRVVAPEQLMYPHEAGAHNRRQSRRCAAHTKRVLREGERSSRESLLEISTSYHAIAHMEPDHHEACERSSRSEHQSLL